jgi:hypothetical protein
LVDFNNREKTLSFFGKNQYSDWRIILSILFFAFFIAMGFALFTYFNEPADVDLFSTNTNTSSVRKIKKDVELRFNNPRMKYRILGVEFNGVFH